MSGPSQRSSLRPPPWQAAKVLSLCQGQRRLITLLMTKAEEVSPAGSGERGRALRPTGRNFWACRVRRTAPRPHRRRKPSPSRDGIKRIECMDVTARFGGPENGGRCCHPYSSVADGVVGPWWSGTV